jgi:hypothetical protein
MQFIFYCSCNNAVDEHIIIFILLALCMIDLFTTCTISFLACSLFVYSFRKYIKYIMYVYHNVY